ncbi:RND efflux system, membrane fusion protein [uncultured Leptolyngbya sp.]|uniref:RND efflux system, membrane fusion protein n=1 Tax=uncultured Leptolyngbya sp. TaxID=332963 RepID=A0A6J4M703_9CYAN|nr:RND efflux system, membrane fusion protein [uncultured Leptolyngbya sp.]
MSASESQFSSPDSSSSDSQSDSQSDLQLISQTDSSFGSQLQSNPNPLRSKKPWVWTLLALSLMTGGVTVARWIAPTNGVAQPAQPLQTPPRAVEVTELSPGSGVRLIELLGQVESTAQATVRAQTNGVIRQVLVQPGDRVTVGMPIAILDDSDQQLALAEAQAQLGQERSNLARLEVGTRPEIIAQRRAALRSAQAREQAAADNLNRIESLVQEGAESQRLLVETQAALNDAQGERLAAAAELAEAEAGPILEEIAAQRAGVGAAEAAVNQAELALQRTQIRAATAGVVQSRLASPGDYLESSGEVVTLVAGDRLDVFLELAEDVSGRISAGMPIELRARALPQWQGSATITGVVPSADPASRRQRIRVQLSNPPQGLLSGMAITGRLELPSNTPGFVISRDALTQRQDQWLVFTVTDGTATQVEVELVSDMGEQVAIASEQLQAGQPIVIRGGDGLQNGAAVQVSKAVGG